MQQVNVALVDAHWQRGNTYLRIGWNWLKGVLHQGWRLFRTFSLQGHTDPEPAFASKKQTQKQLERIGHKLRLPKICQESDLDGVKLIADKL